MTDADAFGLLSNKSLNASFFLDLFPTWQGFDYFFGMPTSNDSGVDLSRNEQLVEKSSDLATLTERYTNETIAFIQKHQEQPFFVYFPHSMPHTRLDASVRFKGKSPRGLYGDVIEEIDFNVGHLLDTINDLDLADNTYVLFTSDNGTAVPSDRVIDGEDIRHLFHGELVKANPEKTYFDFLRVHMQAVRQGQWKLHLAREKEPAQVAPFCRNAHSQILQSSVQIRVSSVAFKYHD